MMEELTNVSKDAMAYLQENNAFNNSSETSEQQHFKNYDQETLEHFQNEFQDGPETANSGHFQNGQNVRAGSTTTIQSHDTHHSNHENNINPENGAIENADEDNNNNSHQVDSVSVNEEIENNEEKDSGPMPVKQR